MTKRTRLGLRLADWPPAWQADWQIAVTPAPDPFAGDGAGAHWAPDTKREIRKRLEQFFGFLVRTDRLNASRSPGFFLSEPFLRPYIEELAERVAPVTRAGYLRDAMIGVRALDPATDLTTIRMVLRRLERTARPTRDKRRGLVAPRLLYNAGIARMGRVETAAYEKEDVRALQYGDGLAMAIAAASLDRLRNLAGIRIGDNLRRLDDHYRLDFTGSETKGRHPHACDLLASLTPWIDHFIVRHRSKLLEGGEHTALFISAYRGPMSRQTMYCRFKAATKAELGMAINPHRVRDMAITNVATKFPEMIGIAPALLHHQQTRTTQEHYNQADQISASRRYNETLQRLRDEALTALDNDDLFNKEEDEE